MNRRQVIALPMLQLLAARSFGLEAELILTRVKTMLGDFVIAVNVNVAPLTVANYLTYVDGGLLHNGAIYRIVTLKNQPPETKYKIEVVQWGMNLGNDKPPPFKPIVHETTKQTGLKHLDGTVSMARSDPGTATAEFFICIGDQPELDFGGRRNPDGQGFAAFGKIVAGMETVRAIHMRGGAKQYLESPIAIESVRRIE